MFDKSLPILNENVNRDYLLPFKRLYGKRFLENHDNRKSASDLAGNAKRFYGKFSFEVDA